MRQTQVRNRRRRLTRNAGSKCQRIAKILSKDVAGVGIERSMHVTAAQRIKTCHPRWALVACWKENGKWQSKERPAWGPACKERLCPYCQAQKAKQDYRRLRLQFEHFDPKDRYTIRLSLARRVSREKLKAARDLLRKRFRKLTTLPGWRFFVRSGGAIHTPPAVGWKRHRKWFNVHMHLIVAAPGGVTWSEVRRAVRKAIRIPKRRMEDCFYKKAVKSLERKAMYITGVANLLPGYPKPLKNGAKKKRAKHRWLLPWMTDEDIQSFMDAHYRRRRLIFHDADSAIADHFKRKKMARSSS